MHADDGQLLLYAAGLVAAIGVLWRGLFRPLRRGVAALLDFVEQWRQTQESIRELAQVVARFVVDFERRLTRVEALQDLGHVVRDHQGDEAATLLGQQLAEALRNPPRRRHTDTTQENP